MKIFYLLFCSFLLTLFAAACNDDGGTTDPGDVTPPAEVSDLAASDPTDTSIQLDWTSPGDDGVTGTATAYDIRYSTATITAGNWSQAIPVTGEPGPQAAPSAQGMTVDGLEPGTEYFFAMKTADEVPNWSGLSNVAVDTTTGMRTLIVAESGNDSYVVIIPTTGVDSVTVTPDLDYLPTDFTFGYGSRRVYFLSRVSASGASAVWGCDTFDGTNLTTLTNHNNLDVRDLDGSPIEEKLVLSAIDLNDGTTFAHIYTMNETGTGLTQISFLDEILQESDGTHIKCTDGEHNPIWSPDGTKIAYYAVATNIDAGSPPHNVWVTMNADGSGKEVVYVFVSTAHYRDAGWSHDGEFLFIHQSDAIKAIHLSSLATTDILAGLGTQPYWPEDLTASPASMAIAFDRRYAGQSPLFIANLNATGSSVSVVSSAQVSANG
ncbi:MAG: fibronectin type III domain-containing protein, partial [Candidatus Eisenbacteria bacterium]|nr:fibronectin type III domain-containing protein [Candidatus Eisenbacteria bacterium]